MASLLALLAGLSPFSTAAQSPRDFVSETVPGRYLLLYREGAMPADAETRVARYGARIIRAHRRFGIAAISASKEAVQALRHDGEVQEVIADRVVSAHSLGRVVVPDVERDGLLLRAARPGAGLPVRSAPSAVQPGSPTPTGGSTNTAPATGGGTNSNAPVNGTPVNPTDSTGPDSLYEYTPQGWAVKQAGGFGAGFAGGTALGAWNTTLGAGVRIAVLDSGIDNTHPDLQPNLALNLSEIDPGAQPSACDDGSPQDQQGHGTWVASLAAGAMGANTGRIIGVAPAGTLLNIKVLHRMPGAGATLAAQCASGEASGLVSWLLKGIDDAVAQHADIVVLSLGSIVDLYSGDGAGLKVSFDRVTYAAAAAGTLIVAAGGNDGFDLSDGRYLELPAQARGVLAVTASTNADCAENTQPGSTCAPGPITRPYYANYGASLAALAAPGGSYPAGDDTGVSGWVRGACSAGKPNTADGPPDAQHSMGCFNLGHQAYVQAMGTSASAGLAGGQAALVRAAHPEWSVTTLLTALRATAVSTNGLQRIDPAAAIRYRP